MNNKNKYWKYEDVREVLLSGHNKSTAEIAQKLGRTKGAVSVLFSIWRQYLKYGPESKSITSDLMRGYFIRFQKENPTMESYSQASEPVVMNTRETSITEPDMTNGVMKRLERLDLLYKEMQKTIVLVAQDIAEYKAKEKVEKMAEEVRLAKKVIKEAKKDNLIDTLKKQMFK